jgi:hypothetical protein
LLCDRLLWFFRNIGRNLDVPIENPNQKTLYIGYHLPILAGVDISITEVKVDGVLK